MVADAERTNSSLLRCLTLKAPMDCAHYVKYFWVSLATESDISIATQYGSAVCDGVDRHTHTHTHTEGERERENLRCV